MIPQSLYHERLLSIPKRDPIVHNRNFSTLIANFQGLLMAMTNYSLVLALYLLQ